MAYRTVKYGCQAIDGRCRVVRSRVCQGGETETSFFHFLSIKSEIREEKVEICGGFGYNKKQRLLDKQALRLAAELKAYFGRKFQN